MTPDKKPFFAATYLPKHSRSTILGLMELLPQVVQLWKNERSKIISSSENISQWVREQVNKEKEEMVSTEAFHQAFEYFSQSFDSNYGGFGSAPKFPSPHNLLFLLRYHIMTSNDKPLQIVEKTLDGMCRGGLYDHIGFGFSRYSTDKKWLVPHFEKMLYDNALLAMAYLEAYQLTNKELYGRIAAEVLTYIIRDMVSPEGGFYSAEDADSEGEEGKFYLWTASEVKSILGDKDGQLYCSLYDINDRGNFEGKNIPNLISKGISESVRAEIESLRQQLFTYREKRVHPYKDDKILTSWNGLMIAAMAIGSRVLGDDRYYQTARNAADFILQHLRRPDGRLLARYREGESLYPAYAADYAFLVWGLIELYQAGFEAKYLQTALELNDDLIKFFWDSENGGLFINGEDSEQLLARPKEDYDGAMPSSNSVAALNFLRLARITGDSSLENMADQQLKAFGSAVSDIPAAHSFFIVAAMFSQNPSQEIVITGRRDEIDSREILEAINDRFLPGTLVILNDIYNKEIQEVIPFIKDMKMVDGRATAYICSKYSCQEPIIDIEKFVTVLL
jgi:uncharacterized protein YyaL (SSP411 family)